jgi:hypothetical protein
MHGPDSNLIGSHVSPRFSEPLESSEAKISCGAAPDINDLMTECLFVSDDHFNREGSARPITAVGRSEHRQWRLWVEISLSFELDTSGSRFIERFVPMT